MKEIQNDIKSGTFRHAYLLYGEEVYLKLQLKKQLADAIVPSDDTMNRAVFSGAKTDMKEVVSLGDTMPFFAERRLILLEDTGFFKAASPELAAYLKELPDYLYLIFVENEIDKRNASFKALTKVGYAADFQRLEEAQLMRWAAKILQDHGRRIRGADMSYFLTRTGNDMQHIRMELAKLIDYTEGRGEVTHSDIDAITSVSIENRVFEMVRAVAEGRREKALALYGDLLALKEPPLRILALLARQYNQMLQAKQLSYEGCPEAEIAKAIGAPPFAVKNYVRMTNKTTAEVLQGKVEAITKTEEEIKSGRIGDRIGVELLLMHDL